MARNRWRILSTRRFAAASARRRAACTCGSVASDATDVDAVDVTSSTDATSSCSTATTSGLSVDKDADAGIAAIGGAIPTAASAGIAVDVGGGTAAAAAADVVVVVVAAVSVHALKTPRGRCARPSPIAIVNERAEEEGKRGREGEGRERSRINGRSRNTTEKTRLKLCAAT